jgi:hypothetical protein
MGFCGYGRTSDDFQRKGYAEAQKRDEFAKWTWKKERCFFVCERCSKEQKGQGARQKAQSEKNESAG